MENIFLKLKTKIIIISSVLLLTSFLFSISPVKQAFAEVACPAPAISTFIELRIGSETGTLVGNYESIGEEDGTSNFASFDVSVPAGTVLYVKHRTEGVEGVNRSTGSMPQSNIPSTVIGPNPEHNGYYPTGYRIIKQSILYALTDPLPVNSTSIIRTLGSNTCRGGDGDTFSSVLVRLRTSDSPDFNCVPIVPTTTIDPGTDPTLGVHTDPVFGFSSNVNYSVTITPDPGTPNTNPPVLGSINGNNQIPPSDTTVNITTTGTTTPGSYSINFNGVGGGQSHSCPPIQLVINPAEGGFNLTIAPQGNAANPVKSLIGNDVEFDLFAECYGGFAGPITELRASTTFTNIPTPVIPTDRLDCGESTTVRITNTGSIPATQQSSIPDPADLHPENVVVTGKGQI